MSNIKTWRAPREWVTEQSTSSAMQAEIKDLRTKLAELEKDRDEWKESTVMANSNARSEESKRRKAETALAERDAELTKAQDELNCTEVELEVAACNLPDDKFNQGFECMGDFARAVSEGYKVEIATLRTAAQQALEALHEFVEKELTVGQRYTNVGQAMLDAITALTAALESKT